MGARQAHRIRLLIDIHYNVKYNAIQKRPIPSLLANPPSPSAYEPKQGSF